MTSDHGHPGGGDFDLELLHGRLESVRGRPALHSSLDWASRPRKGLTVVTELLAVPVPGAPMMEDGAIWALVPIPTDMTALSAGSGLPARVGGGGGKGRPA